MGGAAPSTPKSPGQVISGRYIGEFDLTGPPPCPDIFGTEGETSGFSHLRRERAGMKDDKMTAEKE